MGRRLTGTDTHAPRSRRAVQRDYLSFTRNGQLLAGKLTFAHAVFDWHLNFAGHMTNICPDQMLADGRIDCVHSTLG